jgi:beta-carotene 3-hydroxylase
MEFVAWFTHKYIMHGFLWNLHEDHHVQTPGFFQKNDSFFLIFAVPSWLFIMFGAMDGFDFKIWIGFGILLYGIAYFLFHEVLIHKRLKKLRKVLFGNVENKYLKAVLKAHHAHHKHITKEDGESFGMLIIHPKYWRQVNS